MGTVSREQDSEDSAKQSVWAVESGKCGAAAVRVEGSKTAVTSDEERAFWEVFPSIRNAGVVPP